MRWALSKGKSEVLLPSEIALQYKSFPFAAGQIITVTQARYLGVVLSANGILECGLKNRIQMSHASLSKLRNAKLLFPGVDPSYAKMVYQTIIESKWTMPHFSVHPVQMHYTPLTACCKDLPMLPGNKSAAIADPPSTSNVQYWHIRYPSENVGQRFCWKTHEHSGRWSCNRAAEAPCEKDQDSSELLRSIPADRTTGRETADKRSNYANEAN